MGVIMCSMAAEICSICDGSHLGDAICIYDRDPTRCPYKGGIHIYCVKNKFGFADCDSCPHAIKD